MIITPFARSRSPKRKRTGLIAPPVPPISLIYAGREKPRNHSTPGREQHVRECGKLYQITRNPLYAWEAYRACRWDGQAIPDWVLECFDLAAYNLSDLTNNPPVDPPTAIATAMGMLPAKGPSVFCNYQKTRYRLPSYVNAVLRRKAAGDKTEYAIKSAAKDMQVSESTIRRAWRAYCQSMPDTLTGKNG